MQGQVIDNKYQVIRQLGEGGMGAVYEARHTGTGRRVALKVIVAQALAQGADIVTRFQREARASGAIESDHVVQVLDTGVDATTKNPYMVMELLNGEDVQQLIRRVGALTPDLALRLLSHACLGLKRAHDAGIIHRDIKSANLFIAKRESGDAIVKILDFGIAKVRADPLAQTGGDHGLTRTGSMIGSPLYMSPEQALGLKTLDGRADIWSLGVVLFEALTGRTPHANCETIGQLLIAINSGKFPPVQDLAPWVPPEIAMIAHKAMAHEPGDRFQTAAEMHAAIFALLPSGAVIAQSTLVPMPDGLRAVVAPRMSPTPIGPASADRSGPQSPLAASVAISSSPSVLASAQSTTGGFGASQVVPAGVPRKSPWVWIAPLIAVLAIGGTVAGYSFLSKRANGGATQPSATTPTAALSTPQTIATSSHRTVQVSIAPPDAHADVDGNAVAVHDGKIDITGEIGSVHKVHVTDHGSEKSQDVVIADTGPIPALVSAMKDAPIQVAHPATTQRGTTATVAAATSSALQVTAPPAVTAAPAKTTKSSNTPSIDRNM